MNGSSVNRRAYKPLPRRNRARRGLRNNINLRRSFEETNLSSLFESSGHHVIGYLNVKTDIVGKLAVGRNLKNNTNIK